ncbi:mitotic spindle assembly checkpoint protein MAD2A [Anopheles merus]|uniref:HORMA domain-containing protein n=1 Tax=Anopheles merus TaxID=30066 RepID=A0A182VMC3_ANOME|nr:mitotic spindle assembly checkpoint protein MAD2A [Anopheles merus]
MATSQDHCITLQGSAAIIHEYLKYSSHSIIFQRGIYPASDFLPIEYNGVPMMVSRDSRIKEYIDLIMEQVHDLIMKRMITKVTMCIVTVESKEVVERWDFNIQPTYDGEQGEEPAVPKALKKIQSEIRDVMRQIVATISFLPCLDQRCTFDIMLHTVGEVFEANPTMIKQFREEDIASIEIEGAQSIALKQFSTGLQTVDTKVVYRVTDP